MGEPGFVELVIPQTYWGRVTVITRHVPLESVSLAVVFKNWSVLQLDSYEDPYIMDGQLFRDERDNIRRSKLISNDISFKLRSAL